MDAAIIGQVMCGETRSLAALRGEYETGDRYETGRQNLDPTRTLHFSSSLKHSWNTANDKRDSDRVSITTTIMSAANVNIRVGAVQAEPVWLDLEGSVNKTISLIENAAADGVQVVREPPPPTESRTPSKPFPEGSSGILPMTLL